MGDFLDSIHTSEREKLPRIGGEAPEKQRGTHTAFNGGPTDSKIAVHTEQYEHRCIYKSTVSSMPARESDREQREDDDDDDMKGGWVGR